MDNYLTAAFCILENDGPRRAIEFLNLVATRIDDSNSIRQVARMIDAWVRLVDEAHSSDRFLDWLREHALCNCCCAKIAAVSLLPRMMECVNRGTWGLSSVLPMLHTWMHCMASAEFLADSVEVIARHLHSVTDPGLVRHAMCIIRATHRDAEMEDTEHLVLPLLDVLKRMGDDDATVNATIATMTALGIAQTGLFEREGYPSLLSLLVNRNWISLSPPWMEALMKFVGGYAYASPLAARRVHDSLMGRVMDADIPAHTWPLLVAVMSRSIHLSSSTRARLRQVGHEGAAWENIRSRVREVCKVRLLHVDPMVASDGYTYERHALDLLIAECAHSPHTGEPLRRWSAPNMALRCP